MHPTGYTPNSASNQLQLMAHAGGWWVASRGLGVDELTPARVDEFLEARRAEGYRLWLSTKATVPVLAYLPLATAITASIHHRQLADAS